MSETDVVSFQYQSEPYVDVLKLGKTNLIRLLLEVKEPCFIQIELLADELHLKSVVGVSREGAIMQAVAEGDECDG